MEHFISTGIDDLLQLESPNAGSTRPAAALSAAAALYAAARAHVPAYAELVAESQQQQQQQQHQQQQPCAVSKGSDDDLFSKVPYTTKVCACACRQAVTVWQACRDN
jgi:hypothetical protein